MESIVFGCHDVRHTDHLARGCRCAAVHRPLASTGRGSESAGRLRAVTDRFNAAVANLGSDTETIRVDGIFALERIMQDSPRDQPAVIQVLAAFVREQAPRKDAPTGRSAAFRAPAIDVQTALSVLDTRNLAADDGILVDLDDTDLANANLDDASLRDVTLNFADLSGSDLFSADLTDATLLEANLSNAAVGDTNLSGVRLTGANLAGADLNHANLAAADLNSADLRGAVLFGANLDRVVLIDANLDGARLDGTSWCQGDKPDLSGGYVCTPTAAGRRRWNIHFLRRCWRCGHIDR